jgi:hypothetical protein
MLSAVAARKQAPPRGQLTISLTLITRRTARSIEMQRVERTLAD